MIACTNFHNNDNLPEWDQKEYGKGHNRGNHEIAYKVSGTKHCNSWVVRCVVYCDDLLFLVVIANILIVLVCNFPAYIIGAINRISIA